VLTPTDILRVRFSANPSAVHLADGQFRAVWTTVRTTYLKVKFWWGHFARKRSRRFNIGTDDSDRQALRRQHSSRDVYDIYRTAVVATTSRFWLLGKSNRRTCRYIPTSELRHNSQRHYQRSNRAVNLQRDLGCKLRLEECRRAWAWAWGRSWDYP
jgi:hypothetical protein